MTTKEKKVNSMTGGDVKKLFIMNKINLNEIDYIKNNKEYDINEIINMTKKCEILVNIDLLKEKIEKKYGKGTGKYLIKAIYPEGEEMIAPTKMINFAKNLK